MEENIDQTIGGFNDRQKTLIKIFLLARGRERGLNMIDLFSKRGRLFLDFLEGQSDLIRMWRSIDKVENFLSADETNAVMAFLKGLDGTGLEGLADRFEVDDYESKRKSALLRAQREAGFKK